METILTNLIKYLYADYTTSFKQTLDPRRYTDIYLHMEKSQHFYFLGKTNENQNEILLYTTRRAKIKKAEYSQSKQVGGEIELSCLFQKCKMI